MEQGLIDHIHNLRKRSEVSLAKDRELSEGSAALVQAKEQLFPVATVYQAREISMVSRDIQEESRISYETRYIHPDRVSQVPDIDNDVSNLDQDSSGSEHQLRVIQSTKQFITKSHRERKKLGKQKQVDPLSKTSSGKIQVKPIPEKRRQYLQTIAKPTIAEYFESRK